jgi:hypothetical protein
VDFPVIDNVSKNVKNGPSEGDIFVLEKVVIGCKKLRIFC